MIQYDDCKMDFVMRKGSKRRRTVSPVALTKEVEGRCSKKEARGCSSRIWERRSLKLM